MSTGVQDNHPAGSLLTARHCFFRINPCDQKCRRLFREHAAGQASCLSYSDRPVQRFGCCSTEVSAVQIENLVLNHFLYQTMLLKVSRPGVLHTQQRCRYCGPYVTKSIAQLPQMLRIVLCRKRNRAPTSCTNLCVIACPSPGKRGAVKRCVQRYDVCDRASLSEGFTPELQLLRRQIAQIPLYVDNKRVEPRRKPEPQPGCIAGRSVADDVAATESMSVFSASRDPSAFESSSAGCRPATIVGPFCSMQKPPASWKGHDTMPSSAGLPNPSYPESFRMGARGAIPAMALAPGLASRRGATPLPKAPIVSPAPKPRIVSAMDPDALGRASDTGDTEPSFVPV